MSDSPLKKAYTIFDKGSNLPRQLGGWSTILTWLGGTGGTLTAVWAALWLHWQSTDTFLLVNTRLLLIELLALCVCLAGLVLLSWSKNKWVPTKKISGQTLLISQILLLYDRAFSPEELVKMLEEEEPGTVRHYCDNLVSVGYADTSLTRFNGVAVTAYHITKIGRSYLINNNLKGVPA